MYRILIADDEMPALRFLQAIVEKYSHDFTVAGSFTSGEAALEYMTKNKVDLLLTDISMPSMNGIALSLKVREMQPDVHIAIVTGYADFEYAKGAIKASVDDYILKPVSVTHMTEMLKKIKNKLDGEMAAREPALLAALFSGQPYDPGLLSRLYGDGKLFFALVRWGNLGFSSGKLIATSAIPQVMMPLHALYGRDEDEQLLFMSADQTAGNFQEAVKKYVDQRKSVTTWTIVFSRNSGTFSALPDFFERAVKVMERAVVIGQHQFTFLSGMHNTDSIHHISNADIKKLEYFILERNARMIKDVFITYASEWEKEHLPQIYATTMVQQLTHLALTAKPVSSALQDVILKETQDLLLYAESYGELMAGLYAVLFDDSTMRDKKLSTEDLYAYAVRYIQERYAQPISIQNVCSEIGISQTYLSRLFRKYGNTSFNVFLTQCRLNAAMSLIREHAEISLRDAAACVGYDDYAYFSKIFHQVIGCTPSQWVSDPERQQDRSIQIQKGNL